MKISNDISAKVICDHVDQNILLGIIEGKTVKQIATELFKNHKTLDARVDKMITFLNARSRTELILMAIDLGLIKYKRPLHLQTLMFKQHNKIFYEE